MNNLPELNNVLEILTKNKSSEFHSIHSNEKISNDVKFLVFDILFSFSRLEELLENFLYILYEDKTDVVGILETEDFSMNKKINLFKRKVNLLKKNTEFDIYLPELDEVVKSLKGSSTIRNTIVHIKWNSLFSFDGQIGGTNEYANYDVYFYRYKLQKYELIEEYVNCSYEKLNEMHDYINKSILLINKFKITYLSK